MTRHLGSKSPRQRGATHRLQQAACHRHIRYAQELTGIGAVYALLAELARPGEGRPLAAEYVSLT